jgi:hypothetical protein
MDEVCFFPLAGAAGIGVVLALAGDDSDGARGVWQNRLNYSSSSTLVIAIQLILTQRTSNGTTRWSVGSPPDATTVQQD